MVTKSVILLQQRVWKADFASFISRISKRFPNKLIIVSAGNGLKIRPMKLNQLSQLGVAPTDSIHLSSPHSRVSFGQVLWGKGKTNFFPNSSKMLEA